MTILRRTALVLVVAATVAALAYGAGWAVRAYDAPPGPDRASSAGRGGPDGPGPERAGASSGGPSPDATAPEDRTPSDRPADADASAETKKPSPEPELRAGHRLLGPGDESGEVLDLQARLKQIAWFAPDVTGFYGEVTTAAVRGFQAKREIPVTGEVDQRTLDRLQAMTAEPTEAELTNRVETNVPGALDPRCETGRVLCVDKSSRTLRWVVDGKVQKSVDVRFGSEYTPTREGVFSVQWKSRDHVSTIYDTAMPFAMFFSGGQAVHYSSDFAAVGYAGASHGCVNVRDYDGIAWLFDQVRVGDTVVVYWS